MADVFEEDAPVSQVNRLWQIIRQTPMLDWQLLTKRPQRIVASLPDDWGHGYRNVWLGTSVEDERVIERIGHLTAVPAVVHFLSLEPLIGPLSNLPLGNIQWVIVGGESGPRARPINEEWVLDIRRQCRAATVPFFFKQWGGANKARNGRALQGRVYDEMPNLNRNRRVA
jgi:protein gp37